MLLLASLAGSLTPVMASDDEPVKIPAIHDPKLRARSVPPTVRALLQTLLHGKAATLPTVAYGLYSAGLTTEAIAVVKRLPPGPPHENVQASTLNTICRIEAENHSGPPPAWILGFSSPLNRAAALAGWAEGLAGQLWMHQGTGF